MNIYAFILVVGALIWGLGVFFGFLTGMGKSFKTEPTQIKSDAQKLKEKERRFAEETEEKRQQLMDKMRQNMRDNQR